MWFYLSIAHQIMIAIILELYNIKANIVLTCNRSKKKKKIKGKKSQEVFLIWKSVKI